MRDVWTGVYLLLLSLMLTVAPALSPFSDLFWYELAVCMVATLIIAFICYRKDRALTPERFAIAFGFLSIILVQWLSSFLFETAPKVTTDPLLGAIQLILVFAFMAWTAKGISIHPSRPQTSSSSGGMQSPSEPR